MIRMPFGQYGAMYHRSPVNTPVQNTCHVRLPKKVDRLFENQNKAKDRLRLAVIKIPINQF